MRHDESRYVSRRTKILLAEHPELVRITPTSEVVFKAIQGDLNPDDFTMADLQEHFSGREFTGGFQGFDIDETHIIVAVGALQRAGLIERAEERHHWRMTEAGALFDIEAGEKNIPPEERQYDE